MIGAIATAAVATACSGPAPAYGGPPDATTDDAKNDAPITFDAAYGGPPLDASADSPADAADAAKTDASDAGTD